MSAKDLLTPFIREARSFTSATDQKKICILLGKVAEAEIWHNCHGKLLGKLHCSLSRAYEGRLNDRKGWDTKLNQELDELARLI